MKMPIISVIVPIYKIQENYLERCIKSLMKQTFQNIEIILVDDGSPDKCGEICDIYKKIDSRIVVLHLENAGVSNARNQGLLMARGKYVIFVDGDDWVYETMCEKCYEAMLNSSAEIIVFQNDFSNVREQVKNIRNTEKMEKLSVDEKKRIQLEILGHIKSNDAFVYGSPWAKIFNRKFLVDNNLFFPLGVKKAQDRIFMLRCLEISVSIYRFFYIGYIYNVNNESSICKRYNENIIEILSVSEREFEKFVEEFHQNNIEYTKALFGIYANNIFEIMNLYLFHYNSKLSLNYAVKKLKSICKQNVYRNSIRRVKLRKLRKQSVVNIVLLRLHFYLLAGLLRKRINRKNFVKRYDYV